MRHEENAAMAASAYNKLTGKLAVCVTIAGPGVSNLATGLYDAQADHASVVSLHASVVSLHGYPVTMRLKKKCFYYFRGKWK
jgi:pyruvate oxidase